MLQIKEMAVASANSDRPAEKNLYEQKYSIPGQQMQERLSSNNGRVLRYINSQRQLYSSLKSIAASLKVDGISTKDFYKAIGYLSARGYTSVSRNHQAVKIRPDGIRLLAGTIQDSNITT